MKVAQVIIPHSLPLKALQISCKSVDAGGHIKGTECVTQTHWSAQNLGSETVRTTAI